MVKVLEFKSLQDINEYLDNRLMKSQFDIIPVSRMFEHPQTRLIVSCITYVLIENF
jgi:hypothetical protein